MEHQSKLREFIISNAATIDLTLTSSNVDQFQQYLHEILLWNEKINLTAIAKPEDIVVKHFTDSLAGLMAVDIPPQSVVIDIGSGAGFPGIPLKIVRDDLRLTLIEPVQKKSSFLKSLIGILKLENISTFDGTLLDYVKTSNRLPASFVVMRAMKFKEIEPYMLDILQVDGRIILYRTEPIDAAALDKGLVLEKELRFSLPRDYGDRIISVLKVRKKT